MPEDVSFAWWVVTLSWCVFFAYWFIAAFNVKRTLKRQGIVSRLIVLGLVGTGCQSLITSMANPIRRILPQSVIFDVLACAMAVVGLAITIWARRTLAGNWSASVTLKEGHELIQSGPYRFVRHPIYTGFLLMALAAATVPGRARGFAGFLLTVAGFWYKLRQEEKLMTQQFPHEYPGYKSRVKAIVPWAL